METKKNQFGFFDVKIFEFRKHQHYNFSDWFYLCNFNTFCKTRVNAEIEAKRLLNGVLNG